MRTSLGKCDFYLPLMVIAEQWQCFVYAKTDLPPTFWPNNSKFPQFYSQNWPRKNGLQNVPKILIFVVLNSSTFPSEKLKCVVSARKSRQQIDLKADFCNMRTWTLVAYEPRLSCLMNRFYWGRGGGLQYIPWDTAQAKAGVGLQLSEGWAAEVSLQHSLFLRCGTSFIPKAGLQQTQNCMAILKKPRCMKVALSCHFPADFMFQLLGSHVSVLLRNIEPFFPWFSPAMSGGGGRHFVRHDMS